METRLDYTMRALTLIPVLALSAVAGCFSLGRGEPTQRHYVLGAEHLLGDQAASGELAGLVVGLRRLRLASYLDAPFLVVREEPNRVTYAEFHRWGEPLGGGINRAVANLLVGQSRIHAVDVAPWPVREQYDYIVQLHVERFEGIMQEAAADEGEVRLLATWEILRQSDGAVLARGTTDYRRDGWRTGDHATLVRLLDAGLVVLSRDLASSLSGLGDPLAELR